VVDRKNIVERKTAEKKNRKGNKFMAMDLGNPAIILMKRKLHDTKKA
jgi:hypothetical protein